MFEAAEVGREIPKAEFERLEGELRAKILAAQDLIRRDERPVMIIVSGVEGAGKGEVVDRLNQWLDTRGVDVRAFWDETDEERGRPNWWRFWRAMPARGTVGIFFGSWYTRPIIDAVFGTIEEAEFARQLHRIERIERMLAQDGAIIIKLWFHLPFKQFKKRLKQDLEQRGTKLRKISPLLKEFSDRYADFVTASERALRTTDSGHSPWHVIEACDKRYRDVTTGEIFVESVNARIEHDLRATNGLVVPPEEVEGPESVPDARRTILDNVDLERTVERDEYDKELARLQKELYALAWKAREKGRNTVAVFEGWDAAGKGGAIRRVTASMDARLYRSISVAAPTDEERAHHYLWRFWRHLPMNGYMTLYDRSWYGRVLVERVEGFASPEEWRRAYLEINEFEEQLAEHGVIMLKFWVHISNEEQLRRFQEREQTPWKQHKITDEDWRNREKWVDYEAAVNEMVARTSTEYAPWTLVPGNSKLVARLEILQTFCDRLGKALK